MNWKFIRLLLLWALISALTGRIAADHWVFHSGTENFKFGKTKIVQRIDASKNEQWPVFTFYVYHGKKLMAVYKDVNCQKFFASPDNKYFLGVSNRGVPGTAFIVFDNRGNLIREEKHDYFKLPYYCDESVRLSRKWYDAEQPGVRFEYDDRGIDAILINGCSGERYNLLERIVAHRGAVWGNLITEEGAVDNADIMDLVREWRAAIGRADIEKLVGMVTEDAEFWAPGAAPLTGKEAVRTIFSAFFKRFKSEQDFQVQELVVAGEWAILRGTEINRLTPLPEGEPFVLKQRGISILNRGHDGRWRFARGITNLPPEDQSTQKTEQKKDWD